MNENPLISIAMTCYNQGHFIRDAIKSISNQTYKKWELIIINDCSTDNSLEVIKKCCKEFKILDKVTVVNHEQNKGYGYSLGESIKKSNGELVAIIDSDDALANENAFQISVNTHIKNPNVSLTYSNYNECNRNLGKIKTYKTRQLESDESFLEPKKKIRISHLKVIKKKLYDMTEGINPRLKQTVDKDLILKLEEVGSLLFINEVLFNYRKHNKNLSRSVKRKSREYQKFVTEMRNLIYDEARKRRQLK